MKNRIRSLRKARGITMNELERIVGVVESTISHYEVGRREPDFETLLKLRERKNHFQTRFTDQFANKMLTKKRGGRSLPFYIVTDISL